MASTTVSVHLHAPPARVYAALLDARAVQQWMVPDNMQSVVHEFDAREGGRFRISLTYSVAADGAGKSGNHTDTFHGRFTRLVPNELVEQTVEFETELAQMKGEMRIAWQLRAVAGGDTELVAVHDGLPPGVDPADNDVGTRMSLRKLAALVAR